MSFNGAAAFTAFYCTSLTGMLFACAGRADWPWGWAVMIVYALAGAAVFRFSDPDMLVERKRMRVAGNWSDAFIAGVSFTLMFWIALAVAGLDYGRFGWTTALPGWLKGLGLLGYAAGNGVGVWAMVANRYFATFVLIQEDREHSVVQDGPYRWVRHPGYAGQMLASLAMPLALGSLAALLPAIIGLCGFVWRTVREDRFLHEKLTGYAEYASRTRYRLLPGVW